MPKSKYDFPSFYNIFSMGQLNPLIFFNGTVETHHPLRYRLIACKNYCAEDLRAAGWPGLALENGKDDL